MLAKQLIENNMSENRTLIVGLGKTGLSCARFLASRGHSVAVTDSRVNPPGLNALRSEFPDVAIFTGGFDENAFNAAGQIIISPGVSLDEPLVSEAMKAGTQVISDIELFSRYVTAPVVAITGSNGKSTVTTLLGEMVRHAGLVAKVGGNLGTPVLDLISDGAEPDFYILELSSFQLETTFSLNPAASVVLNVSADHMDRYHDINHYTDVKKKIRQGKGAVVVNLDDPLVASITDADRQVIAFSLNQQREDIYGLGTENNVDWLVKGTKKLIKANDLKIKGRHNLANALAALALAESIGLPLEKTLPCLSGFKGLPHRMQWVRKYNNVDWYNDSKATNVGAAIASINALPDKIVLIMGGEGKGADFTQLKSSIEKKAKAVVLMGKDAELISQALKGIVPLSEVKDMKQAVNAANKLSDGKGCVLLAPACASFDMYNGFEARGIDFMNVVRELGS